jgi:multiple sugar transport system permease protein/putative spermidine/putrescine transport system permease protein
MTALAPAAPITASEGRAGVTRGHRATWLAIGLYAALAITLVAPLVIAFLWSIVDPKGGWFAPNLLPRGVSLHHWAAIVNDRGLVKSIFVSLFISIVVMALSAVLAAPRASENPFRLKRWSRCILAPLIVPV